MSGPIRDPAREQLHSSSSYQQPIKMYLGRFLKPYFKDKLTGLGPPANQETKERTSKMTTSVDEKRLIRRWEGWQKTLLIHSVARDSLKKLIQPKLSKVDYLTQKLSTADETHRLVLREQIDRLEREIDLLKLKKEEELISDRYEECDWDKISNIDFEGTREAEDLRRFWQNFLHPSINKSRWGQEEVQHLEESSRSHEERDWEAIAKELGTGRTAFMCLQMFQRFVSQSFKRSSWSPEEDVVLRELVEKMRIRNFIPYTQMSYFMEGRDPTQLMYRWNQVLDPALRKGPWSKEEDELLLHAVARHGEKNWWKIRMEVPGRTDSACRDRYHDSLKAGTRRGAFDEQERKLLVQLLKKHGVGRWAKIAAEIPNRNDAQCLREWKKMSRQSRRRQLKSSEGGANESRRHWATQRIRRQLVKLAEEGSSAEEEEEEKVVYMDSDQEEEKKVIVVEGREEEKEKEKEYVFPSIQEWVPLEKVKGVISLGQQMVALPPPGHQQGAVCRSTVVGQLGCRVVIGPNPRALQRAEQHGAQTLLMVTPNQLRSQMLCRAHKVHGQPSTPAYRKFHAGFYGNKSRSGRVKDMELHYRLLAAVTPWLGNLLIPAQTKGRPTTADTLRQTGEELHLPSTPLFLLLLQTLNVDMMGCKEVIEERKKSKSWRPPPDPPSCQSTSKMKKKNTVAGILQQNREEREKLRQPQLQHQLILQQLQQLQQHQQAQQWQHQQLLLNQVKQQQQQQQLILQQRQQQLSQQQQPVPPLSPWMILPQMPPNFPLQMPPNMRPQLPPLMHPNLPPHMHPQIPSLLFPHNTFFLPQPALQPRQPLAISRQPIPPNQPPPTSMFTPTPALPQIFTHRPPTVFASSSVTVATTPSSATPPAGEPAPPSKQPGPPKENVPLVQSSLLSQDTSTTPDPLPPIQDVPSTQNLQSALPPFPRPPVTPTSVLANQQAVPATSDQPAPTATLPAAGPTHLGPTSSQPGPTPSQTGPTPSQTGPTPTLPDACPSHLGPTPSHPGPTHNHLGHGPSHPGPIQNQTGPTPSQLPIDQPRGRKRRQTQENAPNSQNGGSVGGADVCLTQEGKRVRKLSQKARALQAAIEAKAEAKKKATPSPRQKRTCSTEKPVAQKGQVGLLPGFQLAPGQSLWIMNSNGLVPVAEVPPPGLQLALPPNALAQLATPQPWLSINPVQPSSSSGPPTAAPPAQSVQTPSPATPQTATSSSSIFLPSSTVFVPPVFSGFSTHPHPAPLQSQPVPSIYPTQHLLPAFPAPPEVVLRPHTPVLMPPSGFPLGSFPLSSCPTQPQPPLSIFMPYKGTIRADPTVPPPLRKEALQFDPSLMFLEPRGAVQDWLSGRGGVVVPGLGVSLPYMPPFVSSLSTLTTLLCAKKCLTNTALQLLAPGTEPKRPLKLKPEPDINPILDHDYAQSPSRPSLICGAPPDSRTADPRPAEDKPHTEPAPSLSSEPSEEERVAAVRQIVAERFAANPAYHMLKARFLSSFTVPALLATIEPTTDEPEPCPANEEEELLKRGRGRQGRYKSSTLQWAGPGAPANHYTGIITHNTSRDQTGSVETTPVETTPDQ